MKQRLIGLFALLAIAVLAFGTAAAQYETQKTADFTISADGTAHVTETSTAGNVDITIYGTSGATGSVSTVSYTGNPQPSASQPDNVKLGHYVVVTFNDITEDEFINATIVITFTDADVAGMAQPYVLYKYNPDTNTYVGIDAVVDYSAHTITAVLTSTTDPLFAIGGTAIVSTPTAAPTAQPETSISLSVWAWIFVAIEAITGFILIIGVFQAQRSSAKKKGN